MWYCISCSLNVTRYAQSTFAWLYDIIILGCNVTSQYTSNNIFNLIIIYYKVCYLSFILYFYLSCVLRETCFPYNDMIDI